MTQIVNFSKDSIAKVVYTKLISTLRIIGEDYPNHKFDYGAVHLKFVANHEVIEYIESLKGETDVNIDLDFDYVFNDDSNDKSSVVEFTPFVVVSHGDKSVKFKMNTYKFNDPFNKLFIVNSTIDNDLLVRKGVADELISSIEEGTEWLIHNGTLNRVQNILTHIVQDVINMQRIDSTDDEFKVINEDNYTLVMNYNISEYGFGFKIAVKTAMFEKSKNNCVTNVIDLPGKHANNLTNYLIQL